MPRVEINDVEMEAQLGERLLSVARRNAAHIGFYCDGNGLCTMCECRIISGADQLNEPTDVEYNWLPPSRLEDGYRLGCQASLRGMGPVKTLTRAEELRRQLNGIFSPPPGTTTADNLRELVANIAMINWEHMGNWPFNLIRTMQRIGPFKIFWPVENLGQFITDTLRITQRMLMSGPAPAAAAPREIPPETSGD